MMKCVVTFLQMRRLAKCRLWEILILELEVNDNVKVSDLRHNVEDFTMSD